MKTEEEDETPKPPDHQFPRAHFPVLLCPQTTQRELFMDYGCRQNICVKSTDSDSGYIVISQKDHWDASNLVFKAQLPAIPLLSPNKVADPSLEPVMAMINQIRCKFKRLSLNLKRMKTMTKNKGVRDSLEKRLQDLSDEACNQNKVDAQRDNEVSSDSSDEDFSCVLDSGSGLTPEAGISRLDHLAQKVHGQLGKDLDVEEINSQYSGGNVQYQAWQRCNNRPTSSQSSLGFLAYTSGPHLNTLSVQGLSVDVSGQSSLNEEVTSEDLQGRVYEISTTCVRGKYYIACRQQRQCCVHEVRQEKGGHLSLHTVYQHSFEEEELTSVCMSPYLAAECAIATSSGNVYLLGPANRIQKVCSDLQPRFECWSPWLHCHFGSHPRLLVVTDGTGVALVDVKCGQPQLRDLFTLPHRCLHQHERVTAAAAVQGRPYYHLVATHYTLLLLDERHHNQPVLQWSHTLVSPPAYLSSLHLLSLSPHNTWLFMMAGHTDNHTLCFMVDFGADGKSDPPRSVSTPWTAATPDDFAHTASSSSEGGLDHTACRLRLEVPLAALCGLSHHAGFTLLQGTGFGDIFHQTFQLQDPDSPADKTCSVGPGYQPKALPPATQAWCQRWLRELGAQLREAGMEGVAQDTMVVDVAESEQLHWELRNMPYPHVLCALCMPSTSHQHRTSPPVPHRRCSLEDSRCFSCGNSLEESAAMMQASKQDRIMGASGGQEAAQLPSVLREIEAEQCKDPTSRLLTKLWQGHEDISQEIKDRNDEIRAEREALIKKHTGAEEGGAGENAETNEEGGPGSDSVDDEASAQDTGSTEGQHRRQEPLEVPQESSQLTHKPPHPLSLTNAADIPSREQPDKTETNAAFKVPLTVESVPSTVPEPRRTLSQETVAPDTLPAVGASRKRRHSTCSQGSVDSVLSESPGFLATPPKLVNSPKIARLDRGTQFLSPLRTLGTSPRGSPVKKKKKRGFMMGF